MTTTTTSTQEPLVTVRNLTFSYDPLKLPPRLSSVDCIIHPGSRILLVGANGAGKSTLLRVLSGAHLLSGMSSDEFIVNGDRRPADQYNGTAYLGGVWRRKRTGFEGMEPFSMDIAVRDMMKQWQEDYTERRDELVKVLGINLDWRMHRVSDGQRKKVRIMLKLLRPFRLCLIDEFAVELDIYSRKRFMDYLTAECAKRNASVIYATHIFDQADDWATHITFMKHDKTLSPIYELNSYAPYQELIARTGANRVYCPMYHLVLNFLEAEQYAKSGGVCSVSTAQMMETEETPKRDFDIYDSGYENGRLASREERKLWEEKKKLAYAQAQAQARALPKVENTM
eukprot:g284.t1